MARLKWLQSWKTPKSVMEVRSFLGLVGYYRRFIKNFSSIAIPLTSFTKQDTKFIWSKKCEESLQTLKVCLITPPILSLPNEIELVIYTNASSQGYGRVLMQNGNVISYTSRQLKKHEKNYLTHNLELGATIFF